MKKILTTIMLVFLIIVACILYLLYIGNQNKISKIKEEKLYKYYIENEITGTELITLLNKVMDTNEKNSVQKDEKDRYIENETDSIKIEIKFKENENIISMEAINKNGTDKFLKYYSNCKFKCSRVEYHSKTKKIKYFIFEEI